MSASAVPKQGDHVFNAIETAVLRPFATLQAMRSPTIPGQHFVHDFLLHSYSFARRVADEPVFAAGRNLIATAGAEEEALREFTHLRPRYPLLARVNAGTLRAIHQRNSTRFGEAAARFEVEVLRAIQQTLEIAVAPTPAGRPAATANPGIAFQQMLAAAYDPAAALVVLTNSVTSETPAVQAVFHSLLAAVADTFDQPMRWREPFTVFRADRPSATAETINTILQVLTRMDLLKAQSVIVGTSIQREISQKARSPQTDEAFGSMLHLIHSRLQQLASGRG